MYMVRSRDHESRRTSGLRAENGILRAWCGPIVPASLRTPLPDDGTGTSRPSRSSYASHGAFITYHDENSSVAFLLRASSFTRLISAHSSFNDASFLYVTTKRPHSNHVWILISQFLGTSPLGENSLSLFHEKARCPTAHLKLSFLRMNTRIRNGQTCT